MYLIVGLGNPGEKYENTRHNTGRIVVENFVKKYKFPNLEMSDKAQALYSKAKLDKQIVELILPETFMNKSGKSVLYASSKHKIKPKDIVVVYDDIDLPLGKIKISFNRGSGGHKGIESIARSLKTKEFCRIRVGVSSAGAKGKTKKPSGEKAVIDFILGKFKKTELETLKKVSKVTIQAIEDIVTYGLEKAMGKYN
jgi:peptidyl-tRNA hydrolase, PTH1 family